MNEQDTYHSIIDINEDQNESNQISEAAAKKKTIALLWHGILHSHLVIHT